MDAVEKVNASLFTKYKMREAAESGFGTLSLSDFC